MHYKHNNMGTCSTQVEFDIENGTVYNVKYTGGCNGNLKALSALVEGMKTEEVIKRLRGITCGMKSTSCSDQLAQALEDTLK
ncbi:MAG: TIGR03905 family TSCPD domain-containing protein [Clostridia bacterium]|nr:TIGR03905 family TSCPD domain-containing protein [Clostridia bacterium]